MPTEHLTVAQALQAVAKDISHIGKNQTNEQQRFKFRGIDDVLDAIHGPLAEHGVAFIPSGVDILHQTERSTRSGNLQFYVRAAVHYRIIGPAGDHIDSTVLAEASDTGDKVSSKLMSMAYKYLAFQVLSIPVSGMDDADAHTPEQAVQIDDPHTSIATSAAALGVTVEKATAKWRAEHGGLNTEEFNALPPSDVLQFAHTLAAFAARNRK